MKYLARFLEIRGDVLRHVRRGQGCAGFGWIHNPAVREDYLPPARFAKGRDDHGLVRNGARCDGSASNPGGSVRHDGPGMLCKNSTTAYGQMKGADRPSGTP